MTIKISTGLSDDMLDTNPIKTIFDYGVIEIYSGSQPSSADDATSGTLLGKITKDGAAFSHGTTTNGLRWGTAASRALPKNSDTWKLTGSATGTAGWFRLKANPADAGSSSTTLPRIDGSCSVGGGGGDLLLATLSITASTSMTIDSFSITLPAS